eukprot:4959653-Pyramimonas_sp.AAC.1
MSARAAGGDGLLRQPAVQRGPSGKTLNSERPSSRLLLSAGPWASEPRVKASGPTSSVCAQIRPPGLS